jgi:nitronate monooxygenase
MTLLELLSIELPTIQAPMAGARGSGPAIAVNSAGGLGSLSCALLSQEGIPRELTSLSNGIWR